MFKRLMLNTVRLIDRGISHIARVGLAIVASSLLIACTKSGDATPVVRPVRTLVVAASNATTTLEFPGEVRPYIESRLGFRVAGKLVERKVELGQTVRKGQVLARLDPQDLRLAQTAAKAQLDAAASAKVLAEGDLRRFEDLYRQNFISKAELDRRRTNYESTAASYDAALANYRGQSNQAGYSELVSNMDGVVTGIDAEPGQVVSAGQSVVRVAGTREKEVVIAVPEDRVGLVRDFKSAQVALWALPQQRFEAAVSEVAAAADPATRTYTVKLGLTGDVSAVRIGMTAVVSFIAQQPTALPRLPLVALTEQGGQTQVWVVDPKTSTVALVPVRVAGPAGNDVLIAEGLVPGQRVVTAGVNLLQPGQRVRVLDASSDLSDVPAQKAAP
ncbi:MAG TPA: efflux RND transporter periplasmic adaptor subunit [Burkholderiaceae bacterium]|nr:efflux RND transporter periplasmic adaptor subunit [Burkholderiaceae bacterium]